MCDDVIDIISDDSEDFGDFNWEDPALLAVLDQLVDNPACSGNNTY